VHSGRWSIADAARGIRHDSAQKHRSRTKIKGGWNKVSRQQYGVAGTQMLGAMPVRFHDSLSLYEHHDDRRVVGGARHWCSVTRWGCLNGFKLKEIIRTQHGSTQTIAPQRIGTCNRRDWSIRKTLCRAEQDALHCLRNMQWARGVIPIPIKDTEGCIAWRLNLCNHHASAECMTESTLKWDAITDSNLFANQEIDSAAVSNGGAKLRGRDRGMNASID
jgi:hypothetical protein